MLMVKSENMNDFIDDIIRGSLDDMNGEKTPDNIELGMPEKSYKKIQKELIMKIKNDFIKEDDCYLFSEIQFEELIHCCITNLTEIALLDLVEQGKVEMTVNNEGEFLFRKTTND